MKKTNLAGKGVHIEENFSIPTMQARRPLLPVARAARKMPEFRKRLKLKVDQLYLDKKPVGLGQLPDALQPQHICTPRDADTVVFRTPQSPLSNLHPCKIEIEGRVYNCSEQFYAAEKARAANDDEARVNIMKETDPFKIMALHKALKPESWSTYRACQALRVANEAKYAQNASLKSFLLNTGTRRIGEASQSPTWGIGLKLHHEDQLKPEKWTGSNHMGKLLESVRSKLTN